MPLPSVNSQLSIAVQFGWTCASTAGSTSSGSPSCPYGVSGPRSLRLSMMLLRARFAVMSSYVGHDRAAIVTSRVWSCADAGAANSASAASTPTSIDPAKVRRMEAMPTRRVGERASPAAGESPAVVTLLSSPP